MEQDVKLAHATYRREQHRPERERERERERESAELETVDGQLFNCIQFSIRCIANEQNGQTF